MTDILFLFFTLGYLLGSLNTSVIVGKIYGKDIRDHGSKGAGLTNAHRVLGKPAALFVLIGDVLKGIIACLIGAYFFGYEGLLVAGAGAVIGHCWPVYFGFKGGKGVLTAGAVLFMANWTVALVCLGFFVIIVALTRYVSLGSICASMLGAAISFLPAFGSILYFYVFCCVMASIIVIKHRANIKRLLMGQENKLKL